MFLTLTFAITNTVSIRKNPKFLSELKFAHPTQEIKIKNQIDLGIIRK